MVEEAVVPTIDPTDSGNETNTRPHFHEKWFGMQKVARLHEAMALAPRDIDGRVVEVGSWEGRSTIEIANYFTNDTVHVIDHWLGDLTNLGSGVAAIARERDVFADFKQNMDAATAGNYEVFRMDWRDYDWFRGPIKFLFIDGEHTFEQVAANIAVAWPMVVAGGVICGDDYSIVGVHQAVHAMLDNRGGEVRAWMNRSDNFWYFVKPGSENTGTADGHVAGSTR